MAYGLGELPGTSIAGAADVIQGETGEFPHVPQLPDRGLGADMVGRTIGLLDSINVDRGPRSWRISPRPGRFSHRTGDLLALDLDTCEEVWGGARRIKAQVVGPWTLGSRIEMSNGHLVLTDRGAMRDLTEALIHGIRAHVADLGRRFDAPVSIQLDEPELPTVVTGALSGTSDFDRIPAVPAPDVAERLNEVFATIDVEDTYLNLCGSAPRWEIARQSGARTVQVTMDRIDGHRQLDGFGETISGGTRIGLGITRPGVQVDQRLERPHALVVQVERLFTRVGVDPQLLGTGVDIHPRTGIGGGTLVDAAMAYRMARCVAEMLERDHI
ncbi:hypothetical protein [Corynebacterium pacaense]|uniref:hypothetical protein n=1 Tax=Corynebacterium pacaense TaxID=1816684 RepID=UPI001FE51BD3|nr:hypothetical protein [Corynebacterium pacaense]